MARQGRVEREVIHHLDAINALLHSANTAELRAFEHRIRNLSVTNGGWQFYRARPYLVELLADSRKDRRNHGIAQESE